MMTVLPPAHYVVAVVVAGCSVSSVDLGSVEQAWDVLYYTVSD